MTYGAVLAHFDVAQITIYVFWLFFFSLIYYLRREDHREGYPLVPDTAGTDTIAFPPIPPSKEFLLADGTIIYAPRHDHTPEVFAAEQVLPWAGAPFEPTGNPMIDGIGPAAYARRADVPDHAYDDGLPKIVPLRNAADFFLAYEDTDPRGFAVICNDGLSPGSVVDVWIDRSEYATRYLEVETTIEYGARRVLVPMGFIKIRAKHGLIKVTSVLAAHFATAPALRNPDVITLLEEDRVCGYFAGGLLYATAGRLEPIL